MQMRAEVKTLIAIGAGVLTIAVGAWLWTMQSKNEVDLNNSKPVDEKNLIRTDSHFIGKIDAPNVLVEFADYQCPACAASNPLVKKLLEGAGKDKVKFVYRHFPLAYHSNAMPAAQASEAAARQGKFELMHNKLFENQKDWEKLSNPKDRFLEYARQIGLDEKQFETDYNSAFIKERIRLDAKDGTSLGVNATPTYFLNGEEFSGWDFTNFEQKLLEKIK